MYRSRVVWRGTVLGRREYKYFALLCPFLVAALRKALYPHLATIANRWNEAMGIATRYPQDHEDFLKRCHKAARTRPTPLLLHYGAGDYNCLHQDLYGEHVFPLQATVPAVAAGEDFSGGEFVLPEQRPRMQSRAEVVPLRHGEAVIFRCITARCRAPAASIASTCATASAASATGTATRSALFFTTRSSETESDASRVGQTLVVSAVPTRPLAIARVPPSPKREEWLWLRLALNKNPALRRVLNALVA